MTSAQVLKYTLNDFDRIKDEGFEYTLSPSVMQIIQSLADQVGAPEYVRTPQFVKRDVLPPVQVRPYHSHSKHASLGSSNSSHMQSQGQNHVKSGKRNQEITDDDWDSIRRYQATILPKRQGVEASIEAIRKLLNKMTTETYETMKEQLWDELDTIQLAKLKISSQGALTPAGAPAVAGALAQAEAALVAAADEDLLQIGEILFTIASGNSFYSALYATLFKELMHKYSFMQAMFDTKFQQVASLFKDFAYVDPVVDYDKFCENNKTNERRRAMSLFYVNLMKQGVLDTEPILELISGLQTTLQQKLGETGHKNIVDEMAEVLFILITNSASHFKTKAGALDVGDDTWRRIKERTTAVSVLRLKAYPSLTNKTIFKHIDMCDKF
jgi:hypothetical protein